MMPQMAERTSLTKCTIAPKSPLHHPARDKIIPLMDTFSSRLVARRKELGYHTRKMFADAIGISLNTITAYERGTVEPGAAKLVEVAKFLDVSIDWLVTGSEPTSGRSAEIIQLWARLSEKRRKELARYASFLQEEEQRQNQENT